jgi:hypothetical protein
MKDLLLAIQTRLQTIEGLRDADVFLSADKDIIESGQKFPCLGIKDGNVNVQHLPGEAKELTLPVEIYVYNTLQKTNASILAVFDLAASVQTALSTSLASAEYVKDVDYGNESAVQLLYRREAIILRKTIFYQYIKEV